MIHCNGEPETAETAALTPDRRRTALLLDRVGRLTLRWITSVYHRWLYRAHMRLAHRFNWHYAPMIGPFPDGSTQRWCQWCGFRQSTPKSTVSIVNDALREIARR